ncbi:hypothetical protein JX266_005577 [Neoarthrinium moseri]|nr:hypothetical protein JX266_005577 [Neoarthrinium moseri]
MHPVQMALMKRMSQFTVPRAMVESQDHNDFNRSAMLMQFLHRRLREQGWLLPDPNASKRSILGLTVQKAGSEIQDTTQYLAEPAGLDPALMQFAAKLDVGALVTLSSNITSYMFAQVDDDASEVQLSPHNITVPVINCISDLASSRLGVTRRDFCCLVRQERVVLAWTNQADQLLVHAADVESRIMGCIWGASLPETPGRLPFDYKSHGGTPTYTGAHSTIADEKNLAVIDNIDLGAEDEVDDEESMEAPPRAYLLTQSVMIGLAIALLIVIEAFPVRLMVVQAKALGSVAYKNLALAVTIPIFAWFTLFFAVVVIGMLFQLLGPVDAIKSGNSHFYSSRPPSRKRHPNIEWPHITVQMPVYKEGLKGVIIPTLNSILAAIRHYENLGGTASIFVCEDGMQAVKPEVSEMRKQFYAANSIGWCARPAHGKDGYERAGKFKKASNMNYCLSFSSRVEDEMLRLLKEKAQLSNRDPESFTIEEEEDLYNQALENMLEKDGGKTWAAGNVRMGEIILIIDCDTRVPVDCLSLGAMEMEESPEVAIIQHASGIMQVVWTIFENAITYFTNLVYTLISFSVGSGDCAPFVGHNAFLRWKAIQSVSFMDGDQLRFWSEDHVSEDFDMSLRLQTAGFVVRLATYDHGEFKEGVSLTASDELLRWEKYAYGCSELVFNPVYQWLWKGPFTKLFIRFLTSNMKVSSKVTILGYIGTYYAIAAALPLCLANYLLFGWVGSENLDHSYLPSWDILCGTLFIFMIASPICFAWFRHRIGQKMFVWAVLESFMWMPFFLIFFGGLSWHISYALLAHMFNLPIGWSSTAKEVEATGLVLGIGAIFKQFRCVLVAMFLLTGGVIYLAVGAPAGWTITSWPNILPLALQIVGHRRINPLFKKDQQDSRGLTVFGYN